MRNVVICVMAIMFFWTNGYGHTDKEYENVVYKTLDGAKTCFEANAEIGISGEDTPVNRIQRARMFNCCSGVVNGNDNKANHFHMGTGKGDRGCGYSKGYERKHGGLKVRDCVQISPKKGCSTSEDLSCVDIGKIGGCHGVDNI